MATTFNVFYLGNFADLDTTEGNTLVENAAALVGQTAGSPSDPLFQNIQTLSPGSTGFAGGGASYYDINAAGDTFRIDGGADQVFDAAATYNATLTYADGTTATITAIVLQDDAGETYLAPQTMANANQVAMEAQPIASITINSVINDSFDGLSSDRQAGEYGSGIDGSAAGETMADGYTDADGDQIGSGGDIISGGGGDDSIDGGTGNDTIYGGTGNDTIASGSDGGGTLPWTQVNDADDVEGTAGVDYFTVDPTGVDTAVIRLSNSAASGEGDGVTDYVRIENTGTLTDLWIGDFDMGVDQIILPEAYSNIVTSSGSGFTEVTLTYANGNQQVLTIFSDDGWFNASQVFTTSEPNAPTDDDALYGGDDADTFVIADGFGSDTIVGGEGGNDDDTLDLSALSGPVTVSYTGDEAGTVTDGADTLSFSEIERLVLGDGDDSVVGSADSAGISVDAGAGNDTVRGGSGQDSVIGGSGNDSIDAGAGNDSLTGGAGDDTLIGGTGDDTLVAGNNTGAGDSLLGGTGNDVLIDSYWNATLDGGSDADLFVLGYGDATVIGGEGGTDDDTISFAEANDAVSITLTGDEAGTYQDSDGDDGSFTGIENFELSGQGDTLSGAAASARMQVDAGAGADSIEGGSGADSLDGGSGNDTIRGGSGSDTITGGTGNDSILGGDGNDVLDGSDGEDTIDGGAGNDTLLGSFDTGVGDTFIGGTGIDDLWIDGSDVAAFAFDINLAAGSDQFGNTYSGIENVYGGAGDDTLQGDANDNILSGGDGADRFVVVDGFGNDTISGGSGGNDDDVLDLSALTFGVTVSYTGAETGTITDGTDTLSFEDIERIILGAQDDVADGASATSGINVDGGAGNDTLSGHHGADDTLLGGDGNDELRGWSGDDSLVGGAGNDSLIGDKGNDTLEGGAGDDTLGSWTGAASMDGGDDADTFRVFNSGGGDFNGVTIAGGEGGNDDDVLELSGLSGPVTVTYTGDEAGTVTDGTDTLSFSEIERLILGDGSDSVDASSGVLTLGLNLDAGGGNDTVQGSGVADTIVAGDGNDSVMAGGGNDSIEGGQGSDSLFGQDGDDTILGGSEGDLIEGGNQNDVLDGGTGDDSIDGGDGSDTILGGDGADAIEAGEELNFGDDDLIYAGAGNDTITSAEVDSGSNDTIYGEDGNDLIAVAGGDANLLDGGADNDTIFGAAGTDTLVGGTGDDYLFGGGGDDVYVFADGAGRDTIADFDLNDTDGNGSFNDQLDVSGITRLDGSPINASDITVTDDGFGNALLTFPRGDQLVLQGVTPAQMSTRSELRQAGVPCFTAGTWIATPVGPRLVEDIEPGDRILTKDNGPQEVVWTSQTPIPAAALEHNERLRPLLVPEGAIGNAEPILVSRQHCFLIGPEMGLAEERLARTLHLRRGGMAQTDDTSEPVTYVHLMCRHHQIVYANGIATETFYPGPNGLKMLPLDALARLRAIFPEAGSAPAEQVFGPRARPLIELPGLRQALKKRGLWRRPQAALSTMQAARSATSKAGSVRSTTSTTPSSGIRM